MIEILLIVLLIGIAFYLLLGGATAVFTVIGGIILIIKYLIIVPWAYILQIQDSKTYPFVYYFMFVDLSFPKESGIYTKHFLAPKAENAILYGKVLSALKNGC